MEVVLDTLTQPAIHAHTQDKLFSVGQEMTVEPGSVLSHRPDQPIKIPA